VERGFNYLAHAYDKKYPLLLEERGWGEII
jgi:hypothetical protein